MTNWKRIVIPVVAVWAATLGAAALMGDGSGWGPAVKIAIGVSVGVTAGTLVSDWKRRRKSRHTA